MRLSPANPNQTLSALSRLQSQPALKQNSFQSTQPLSTDVFFSAHQSSYPVLSITERSRLFSLTGLEWPESIRFKSVSRRPQDKHPRTKVLNKAIGVALGLVNPNNSGSKLQITLTRMLDEAEADDIESLLDEDLDLDYTETLEEYEKKVADALRLKVYKYALPNILTLSSTVDYLWFLQTAQLEEGLDLVEDDLRLLTAGYSKEEGLQKLKSGDW